LINFIHLYLRAKKTVILCDGRSISARELELLWRFVNTTATAALTGPGLIRLNPAAMTAASSSTAWIPLYLPSGIPVADTGKSC
jgi:hypothetical protein